MQGKILNFNKNADRYMQLSTKKAEQGDLTASLGFLFSALTSCEKDRYKIFEKILVFLLACSAFYGGRDYDGPCSARFNENHC